MPISRASGSSTSGRRGELALSPDRLDPAASVDAMLVTLLPGEQATFHVTTAQPPRSGGADLLSGAALHQRVARLSARPLLVPVSTSRAAKR